MKPVILSILLVFSIKSASLAQEAILNELITKWHHAAATGNGPEYFGFFTDDAVFIGTDAHERWDIKEFKRLYYPYFKKESAWTFLTIDRKIELSKNKKWAYFDESLDTWMGECRGSGVLVKIKKKWYLKHYHLSLSVPNGLTRAFGTMINEHKAQQTYNFTTDTLALKGYDPVSYYANDKPLLGQRKYCHTHEGLKYFFSSQEHLDRFKSNPQKYSPQVGGWCAYNMSKGDRKGINPLQYLIILDRLYLFENKKAKAGWVEQGKEYLLKATLEAWNKIKNEQK